MYSRNRLLFVYILWHVWDCDHFFSFKKVYPLRLTSFVLFSSSTLALISFVLLPVLISIIVWIYFLFLFVFDTLTGAQERIRTMNIKNPQENFTQWNRQNIHRSHNCKVEKCKQLVSLRNRKVNYTNCKCNHHWNYRLSLIIFHFRWYNFFLILIETFRFL